MHLQTHRCRFLSLHLQITYENIYFLIPEHSRPWDFLGQRKVLHTFFFFLRHILSYQNCESVTFKTWTSFVKTSHWLPDFAMDGGERDPFFIAWNYQSFSNCIHCHISKCFQWIFTLSGLSAPIHLILTRIFKTHYFSPLHTWDVFYSQLYTHTITVHEMTLTSLKLSCKRQKMMHFFYCLHI